MAESNSAKRIASESLARHLHDKLSSWALSPSDVGEALEDLGYRRQPPTGAAARKLASVTVRELRVALAAPGDYDDAEPAILVLRELLDWEQVESELRRLLRSTLERPPIRRAIARHYGQ